LYPFLKVKFLIYWDLKWGINVSEGWGACPIKADR
jgi:hypothetical protein